MLALLRLDASTFSDDATEPFAAILAAADAMDLGPDAELLQLRDEEGLKLETKLQAVRAREAEMRRLEAEEEEDEDDSNEEDSCDASAAGGDGAQGQGYDGAVGGSATAAALPSVAEMFKKKEGQWDCAQCFTRNPPSAPSACLACEAPRPGVQGGAGAGGGGPQFGGAGGASGGGGASGAWTSGSAASIFTSTPNSIFGGASTFGGGTSAGPPLVFGNASPTTPTSPPIFFGSSFSTSAPTVASASLFGSTSVNVSSSNSRVSEFSLANSAQVAAVGEAAEVVGGVEGPKVELVQVKTGEEEEDVLFCRRAKMFRFDADKREWKERGLGLVKLLMHRESEVVRVLMRREHTLKVCANHVVSDQLKIEPMAGSEKAITYYTSDHSGINNVGEDTGEVVTELFAFRFKTPTECQEWTDALEKCKRHDLGSFERVSAMDLSQRPARKEEADVLAEDGQDAVGDGVPPVADDLPLAAQFDVDLPRMSPPFSLLLA
jgi:Ran-binding protein 1